MNSDGIDDYMDIISDIPTASHQKLTSDRRECPKCGARVAKLKIGGICHISCISCIWEVQEFGNDE
jgi:hypothetical protein